MLFQHFNKILDEPTYKRNLQTMEILINLRWFQSLIYKARRIIGIPRNGYSNRYREEPSCYVLLSEKEDWEWPNRSSGQYYGKNKEFYRILDIIFERSGLSPNFQKAIETYIYYNKLSAPGVDFLIDINFYHKKHPASLPQVKQFRIPLDTNNKEYVDSLLEALCNSKCFSSLQIKRLDPKRGLSAKLSFLKKIEKTERELEKAYSKMKPEDINSSIITDKDIASALLAKKGDYSVEDVARMTKRIRNTRLYLSIANKERGFPQD